MKCNQTSKVKAGLLALACVFATGQSASANFLYHVDLNTSVLTGNSGNPFSLDFQLSDGSGSFAGVNTVSIFNFNLVGGAAAGSPSLFGTASGNLNSSVSLSDGSSFLNEFFQGFSNGTSKIGFDVSMTQNVDPGSTPDFFTIAILDNTLGQIATTDPQGVSLVSAAIDSSLSLASIQTFSSVSPAGVTSAVPEPSSVIFIGLGGVALALGRNSIRRRNCLG